MLLFLTLSRRLCSALLVLACWPSLVARLRFIYEGLSPMVRGSLFPVIVNLYS